MFFKTFGMHLLGVEGEVGWGCELVGPDSGLGRSRGEVLIICWEEGDVGMKSWY